MTKKYTILICDDSEAERSRFYERQFDNFHIYGVTRSAGLFVESVCLDSPEALYKELNLLRVSGGLPDLILLDLFYKRPGASDAVEKDVISKIVRLKQSFRKTRQDVLSYLAPTGLDLLKRIRRVDKIDKSVLPILVYTDKNFNFLSSQDFNDLYELDPGFAYKDRDDADLRADIPVVTEYLRLISAIESAKSASLKPAVFVTHGRSNDWIPVAHYLRTTLGLEAIECAEEASRGQTIIQKISELAGNCSFAVIVMTADDQQADGTLRARENVMHEVGYFQGRYGLDRVCILHEDVANVPTNLSGIVYIPYAKGKVDQCYDALARELHAAGLHK